MALLYQPKCKVCTIIMSEKSPNADRATDAALYRYVSKHKQRQMTVDQIVLKYPSLSRGNVQRHATKHQTLSDAAVAKIGIEGATVEEMKDEIVTLKERVFSMEQTKTDMSKVADILMQALEEGKIKPALGPLVTLLAKQASISEKEIDQKIGMVGLMAKYASGEVKQLKGDEDGSS